MDRVAAQQSFSRTDIRVVIKYSMLLDKPPMEIHADLVRALSDNAPSVQTVRKWVAAFQQGREDVEDEERSGRPPTACSEENVELVRAVTAEDRRLTCEEVSETTGLSSASVFRILTNKLNKRKVFAKWVPHLLSEEQKAIRVQTSRANLRRLHRDERFIGRIVTGDETWVYSWDAELKRQSAEWRDKGTPRPEKARRRQGCLKVMHIVFFDCQGLLLSWAVPVGTKVNADYYKFVLQEKLRPAIRKKRPGLVNDVILHHDNAPVHCARKVTALLDSWGWEIMTHPPYSPDLAPCDFHLFPKMKETLRGRRFESSDEIEAATRTSLQRLDKQVYSDAFDAWSRRWTKCVEVAGLYVE